MDAPVNPNDPGRGPLIMSITWILTGSALLVVAARFYVRRKVARAFTIEDWLMFAAVVR